MASRAALKIAADERRYGWLMERGALSWYDEAKARAQAEAVECAVCGRLVHPTNMKRHNDLYHTPPPSPLPIAMERGSATPAQSERVPLLCAVNPGSPLAVGTPPPAPPQSIEEGSGTVKVVQMPMMGMVVVKAKASLIAMMATALVDAAIDGDYAEVDKALAEIQHELYRACGGDSALRAEYKAEIRKELYCSDVLETLESVA